MAPIRLLVLAGLIALATHEACGAQLYSAIDLGSVFAWRDPIPVARDLNNRGDVLLDSGVYHSYGPDAGKVTRPAGFRSEPGQYAAFTAMNDRGDVAGSGLNYGGWNSNRPFVSVGGTATSIPSPPVAGDFRVVDINNHGEVILSDHKGAAFRYRDGEFTRLGDANSLVFPRAINDHGQVAADVRQDEKSPPRATLFSDGKAIDAGTLGGSSSGAYGINDRGEMVGTSSRSAHDLVRPWLERAAHAFIHSAGKMIDLGNLDGYDFVEASAGGINNRGQIVGSTNLTAVLWESGSIYDLNTLLRVPTSQSLMTATKINDLGQILAFGVGGANDYSHAYLLTPDTLPPPGSTVAVPAVPEPSTMLVFGMLALGLAGRVRCRPRRVTD
ncbi:MAG: PEP-CTERM sorting domain-containing protein [Isosphaeraceae bacterium]